MRADRTVIRAVRAGTQRTTGRVLCRTCWTSHYRQDRVQAACPPDRRFKLTPDELAAVLDRARTERIQDDIAAYAQRKAS